MMFYIGIPPRGDRGRINDRERLIELISSSLRNNIKTGDRTKLQDESTSIEELQYILSWIGIKSEDACQRIQQRIVRHYRPICACAS